VSRREDLPIAAIGIMVITVFLFTVIDTSGKWLILAGMPVMHVVASRYIGAFAVNLVYFTSREGLSAFKSNRPWFQLLRALVLLASTALNFKALSYLPISLTISFYFALPVMTTLLSIPLLGEKVGIRRLAAILVGFLGVLVIVQPWGAAFRWEVIYSIAALLTASFYFVMTRMMAGVDENSTCQLWSSGFAALLMIPFVSTGFTWPSDPVDVAVFLGIGVVGAVSHILVTVAYYLAPAKTVAPVTYVQAIYAAAAGYFVFGTTPSNSTALGTAIIIASGLYIWRREMARQKTTRSRGHPKG